LADLVQALDLFFLILPNLHFKYFGYVLHEETAVVHVLEFGMYIIIRKCVDVGMNMKEGVLLWISNWLRQKKLAKVAALFVTTLAWKLPFASAHHNYSDSFVT
jgi:hypothetical protein